MLAYLRHLFVPHHTNNFRAKVLHADFFALYLIFFVSCALFINGLHTLSPDILGFATDIHVEKLVEATNKKRAEAGVPPVSYNATLSQAAAGKAADMFSQDYWAHTAPDGKTPWDFIIGAGYSYIVAGENLAKNFNDSSSVVEAWMNSPSHRENLLRDQYQDVGFAVVNGRLNGEETTLVVQMFGRPNSAIAQAPTTPVEVPEQPAAQIEASPIPTLEPSPETILAQILPTPDPTPLAVGFAQNFVQPSGLFLGVAQSVVTHPLVDIRSLSRVLTAGLSMVLLGTLAFDAVYVWKHKIIRVGGRTSAHLFFLFGVTGLVWLVQFGSIL